MTTTDERPAAETLDTDLRWETACPLERLQPERGVAALFGDEQVAIFRTHDGSLHALGNVDPRSGAAVLSRGIVGDRGGEPIVASPVYKEAYSLVDGRCLDAPGVSVPVHPVRLRDGLVQIGLR
ncbi:nitrite reductase small subunit NirD [Pseudonocardia kujensis]|uniref:nitrite reductase small subunit NirD n=1 Tax=Pseudonocardia kujensis TaxID=1128675 RepID=UPI001E60B91B|nr:nitrite reductase small subunit NirD [Pseudonocardia kujensis]MCE0768639.1 nitrite reductase small subunit NirD [Pseudonocardia kujensis]